MPRRRQKRARAGARRAPNGGHAAVSTASSYYKTERRHQSALVMSPSAMLGGFPDKLRTTLRYAENIVLTSTSGSTATYYFRGNSVFDPNGTGTGGQPSNYDDIVAHYDRYRVFGSRISVIFTNGSNSNVPGQAVLYPGHSGVSGSIPDFVAQPYAVGGVVSNASNPLTLTNSATTSKILGRTIQQVMGSDNLAAQYNANPGVGWDWYIVWQSIDQSSSLISQCVVVLDYDVEFLDRIGGNIDARIARLLEIKRHKERRLMLKADAKLPERKSIDEKSRSNNQAWSDVDDSDEQIYADFKRWMKAQPAPTPRLELKDAKV